MKALTVEDLLKLCKRQVALGNGDRKIMISDDDEGNGYHYLWYSFQTPEEYDKELEEYGLKNMEFDYNDDRISKKEETIILG